MVLQRGLGRPLIAVRTRGDSSLPGREVGTGFLVNANQDYPTVTGASHLEEPHFSLNPPIFRRTTADDRNLRAHLGHIRRFSSIYRDIMTISRLTLVFVFVVANVCATLAAPVTYDQQQTGDLNVQVHLKDIQIVALMDSSYLGDYGDYDYAYDYSDFTIKPIAPHTTTSRPGSSTSSTTSVEPWHTWPTVSGPPSSTTTSGIGEAQSVTAVADQVTVNSSTQSSTAAESGNEQPEKVTDSLGSTPAASSSVEAPEASLKIKATILASETIADNTDGDHNSDLTVRKDKKDEKDEKDEIAAVPAPDQLQASVSSTEENPSTVVPETIQAPTDQAQVQQTRKCATGYTRDQKGRCRRTHNRRRVPSSLLPFGIRLAPRTQRHRDQQTETDSL